MKGILMVVLLFSLSNLYSYFDGGINYTTGKDGYTQQDIYLLVGKNNWWIKPEFSSYKANQAQRINRISSRLGFEKESYTFAFEGGITPEVENYKNLSIGADLTLSLNPTSSSRRRLAGPNSGFISKSAKGVTQIDLGGGAKVTSHKYLLSNEDLLEYHAFLFVGAKVFLTQLSANYSMYNYSKDDIAKNNPSFSNRVFGVTSYLPIFLRSNFNFKVEIPGSPLVTPYLSYNRVKTLTLKSLDVYSFGAYIDLAMVGITTQFETYKDTSDKTQRYLSLSCGIRF